NRLRSTLLPRPGTPLEFRSTQTMTDPKTFHAAAIDLGATSGRVIVGTYANSRLSLQEIHRFSNAFHYLGGHAYWDLPLLFSEIAEGLRKAKQLVPGLASCGVDT